MRTLVACIILFSGSLVAQEKPPHVLGVLEDNVGHSEGEPHYRSVRAVFYRERTDWKAFPHECRNQDCLKSLPSRYPKRIEWAIGFNGRLLGNVTTKAPDQYQWYADVGQQRIVSRGPIPVIGKASNTFAGWLDVPVLRPLVASSSSEFNDLEQWHPVGPPDSLLTKIRKRFREMNPKLVNCENGKSRPYADNDIHASKSYTSLQGRYLVHVGIDLCAPEDDLGEPLDSEWFLTTPEGTVQFIGRKMVLVDAGDYDQDGKSEVVFLIDDHNRGGYRLFYEDFTKSVIFEFSYH